MKTIVSLVSALTALAASTAMAQTTYPGSGVADGSAPADGGAFNSVVISNSASTISFTINSAQPMASYIFYSIELQMVGQAGSGYTGLVNPWGPHVGISTGVNALINTYGSGATPLTYNGSWVSGSGTSYAAGGTGFNSATITLPLSSLGLSLGNSFNFDVVSSYTGAPAGRRLMAPWTTRGIFRSQTTAINPGLVPIFMTRPHPPERPSARWLTCIPLFPNQPVAR